MAWMGWTAIGARWRRAQAELLCVFGGDDVWVIFGTHSFRVDEWEANGS